MNIGVIFAGGVGKRMNSRVKPKQFLNVYGKPIIIHTLEVFDSHPDIDAIVVACLEEWIPYLNELIDKYENWEQKLDTREKELDQREAELNVREQKLEQQEAE